VALDEKQCAVGAGTITVPLRPCLGALAVVFLALGMASKRPSGFVCGYTPFTLVEMLAAGLLGMAACFVPPRAWVFPAVFGRALLVAACLVPAGQAACGFLERPDEPPEWVYVFLVTAELALAAWVVLARRAPATGANALAAALALFLSGEAVFNCDVNEPIVWRYLTLTRAAAILGFVLTASLLIHVGDSSIHRRRLFWAQVIYLFASGAVLRFAPVAGSLDPGIDVWRAAQAASDHILAGENPYAADYEDEGAPFYPPLPFLVGVPFRALGRDVRLGDVPCDLRDVRLGNVVCDLVAALALFAAAGRGPNRLTGALLTAGYLNLPHVSLILQLAWYEPMLAAALGGGAWLAARGWRLGYFVMGLGLTGKQYAVVLLPALWKGLGGHRVALLLGTAAAGAAVVLPFYLWGPRPFVERVVEYHMQQPVRKEGVTLQAAALNRFQTELPRPPMLAAALVLIGLLAWRAPSRGRLPAVWMATSLIIFCLFFTQAFINYYYLCAYLMLLGLADWFAGDEAIPGTG
jgi:hypothetical protein